MDALTASYYLYPRSRVVIRELAGLLPLLGYKDEGLSLNKEAVDLFPFDIEFRTNYITLLYAYGIDRDAVEEIRKAINLTRTVGHLKGKAAALKETVDMLSRPYEEKLDKLNDRISCLERVAEER
ncbi:MAG: hypothetical protein HZA16_14310 [Nitrospirae bacterium]|nr:hypothetical protein [Nitrospirota bacterium]